MNGTLTDEELMAFADGMLDPERAEAVREAVARDPALAERVEMFRASAALLGEFGQAQEADVPDAILERVRELATTEPAGEVITLASRRAARAVPLWQLPLAASIFLAVGIVGTLALRPQSSEPGGGRLALLDSVPMHEALGSLQSGETRDFGKGQVTVISSFADAEGALCREIEYAPPTGRTIIAVSCHRDGGWGVRMAVADAAVDAQGYAPASSTETVDAYLASIGAGTPMDEAQEAAALQRLP
ncbi:MAG: anti-sigma factor family protein [Tropicimonas sp.]|uniref:anti-sigma factor family protein n=1 Tax=Tropicimonas sp. TaxID=2067044 RepID=UPI003A871CA5